MGKITKVSRAYPLETINVCTIYIYIYMNIYFVVEIFQSGQSGGPTLPSLSYCHTTSVTRKKLKPGPETLQQKALFIKKSGFSGWRVKDPRGEAIHIRPRTEEKCGMHLKCQKANMPTFELRLF